MLDGIRITAVHPNGSIKARGCIFNVSYPLRGKDVYVIYEAAGLLVFDDRGTLIVEHNWPPPGIKVRRQRQPPRTPEEGSVTDVQIHEVSPMS